ncbi:hypothetical protein [Lentzea aerocolonigenes]|uniref:hypothetical protein n=1 Tax=Lentzea aerocolonigenes TaxID=68170 RepID=UPI000B070E6B|nr:hypothetical protein [Lentzea aerocolonigenes]MCP2250959.1 hypothetical protein [Lentzea aerocolonigenes]
MKITLASAVAALALMAVAGCGVDVPAGLEDKVNSGCPGLVKPEPVAIITRGLEVSQVDGGIADSCKVSVRDGREVLLVSLVGHPSQEVAERLTGGLCPSGVLDEPDKSCTASEADSGAFAVHGVAGRWEVRIKVYEIPVNDEVKGAVHQLLEDLRNSSKTK